MTYKYDHYHLTYWFALKSTLCAHRQADAQNGINFTAKIKYKTILNLPKLIIAQATYSKLKVITYWFHYKKNANLQR